jgi:hypothetical protein
MTEGLVPLIPVRPETLSKSVILAVGMAENTWCVAGSQFHPCITRCPSVSSSSRVWQGRKGVTGSTLTKRHHFQSQDVACSNGLLQSMHSMGLGHVTRLSEPLLATHPWHICLVYITFCTNLYASTTHGIARLARQVTNSPCMHDVNYVMHGAMACSYNVVSKSTTITYSNDCMQGSACNDARLSRMHAFSRACPHECICCMDGVACIRLACGSMHQP